MIERAIDYLDRLEYQPGIMSRVIWWAGMIAMAPLVLTAAVLAEALDDQER